VKKSLIIKYSVFCFFITLVICFFVFFEKTALRYGQAYFQKADFQKAALCYKAALRYDSLNKKLPFADKKALEKKIDSLYLKIAECYAENGDIASAAVFDEEVLSYYKNKNIENEDFINYLEMETADNYVKTGYFDKAEKIYIKLKDWYPQNLIKLYLYKKDYSNAEKILFSGDIQKVIFNGDDIDSAVLNYLLLRYYLETEKIDEILEFMQNDDLDIETRLMAKIILAELYEKLEENEEAYKLYEELLFSPYLKNSSDYIFKIRYASLADKLGKTEEAKEIIGDLENTQQKFYKYSPQKICTQYYKSQIFQDKNDYKSALRLFKKLNLKKQSYFYNNIDDFCRVNTSI